jgi:hypothetical protein
LEVVIFDKIGDLAVGVHVISDEGVSLFEGVVLIDFTHEIFVVHKPYFTFFPTNEKKDDIEILRVLRLKRNRFDNFTLFIVNDYFVLSCFKRNSQLVITFIRLRNPFKVIIPK